MIYEYHCQACGQATDVVKSVKEIDRIELCSTCKTEMHRVISTNQALIGSKTLTQDAYYHPALGQIVKNDKDAANKARSMNLVEVGNEDVAKAVKGNTKRRDYTWH